MTSYTYIHPGHTYIHTCRGTGIQADLQGNIHTDRHICIRTHRGVHKKGYTHTARQAYTQAGNHTYIHQICREAHTGRHT